MPEKRILLGVAEAGLLNLIGNFLRDQGYQVCLAADGLAALEALHSQELQLALLDLDLPGLSGLELLSRCKEQAPQTQVILFTGVAGVDRAIQALRLGAYDYLLQDDLRLDQLQAVVERALEHQRLTRVNQDLLDNLRQAQEDLARQRGGDLAQVRRLSEALAAPLTWEQLFHGLLNLIWESLHLEAGGIVFRGAKNLSLVSFRHQPTLGEKAFHAFKTWMGERFNVERGLGAVSTPLPFPALLQETVRVGDTLTVMAAGRSLPFSKEETESFGIFILQGEAALRNLLLFEEVKALAIRDGLTGLYNYRYFWEMVLHEVQLSRRYGTPLTLLFLDLDNFKVINDTLGHPQGDTVLKTLGAYLKGAVRQADVVCRYGGEEFVVLLPRTSLEQAMILAQRLRQDISQLHIPLGRQSLLLSVSIGVAALESGMDAIGLVNAADAALYQAKRAGKNRVCQAENSG